MAGAAEKHRVTLKVPNISCGHCVKTITRELKRIEAVTSVEGNVEHKEIVVEFAGDALPQIRAALEEIGYPAA